MPAKTQLAAMTWKEAEEAFKDNPVIIVPNALIEQHGPQTPVDDFRVGEIVASHLYLDYLDVVPNGVMGDITLASAEAGEKFVDRAVELGVEYVRVFEGVETRR